MSRELNFDADLLVSRASEVECFVKPHSSFEIIEEKNKQAYKIVVISPKDRILVFSAALDNFPLTVELDISIIHGRNQPFFVLKTKLLNENLARRRDDYFAA